MGRQIARAHATHLEGLGTVSGAGETVTSCPTSTLFPHGGGCASSGTLGVAKCHWPGGAQLPPELHSVLPWTPWPLICPLYGRNAALLKRTNCKISKVSSGKESPKSDLLLDSLPVPPACQSLGNIVSLIALDKNTWAVWNDLKLTACCLDNDLATTDYRP